MKQMQGDYWTALQIALGEILIVPESGRIALNTLIGAQSGQVSATTFKSWLSVRQALKSNKPAPAVQGYAK